MPNIIKCGTDNRRNLIADSGLNAIDYLEVKLIPTGNGFDAILYLHFFNDQNIGDIHENNVVISGGVRRNPITVYWAKTPYNITPDLKPELGSEYDFITSLPDEEKSKILVVKCTSGDFSIYTLILQDPLSQTHLDGFDVQLSKIDFSFRVDCPSDFDCKQSITCATTTPQLPVIDYNAKDYASFRRLMLDRIHEINPKWTESNPSDMGVMLVELLAYVGDQLSYYQDSVATESYLGTARRRISIRRHARLLDYYLNEGCNARAWVCFNISTNNGFVQPLRKGTPLIAGGDDTVVKTTDLDTLQPEAKMFQTAFDVNMCAEKNELRFHAWSDSNCWLPKGATNCTIRNDDYKLFNNYVFDWNDLENTAAGLVEFLTRNFNLDWLTVDNITKIDDHTIKISSLTDSYGISLSPDNKWAYFTIDSVIHYKFYVDSQNGNLQVCSLDIQVGDVIIMAEKRSPTTGEENDADKSHIQAIRLTGVDSDIDTIDNTPIVQISWGPQDALTFPLCMWELGPDTITDFTFDNVTEKIIQDIPDVPINAIWINVPSSINGAVLQFESENDSYSKAIPSGKDILINFEIPLNIKNVKLTIAASTSKKDSTKIGFITNNKSDSSQILLSPLSASPLDKLPDETVLYVGNCLPVSVAYGNVVLADHGDSLSSSDEDLGKVMANEIFYPKLGKTNITFCGPEFDPTKTDKKNFTSAAGVFSYDPRDAIPSITISRDGTNWSFEKDLLESNEFDTHFTLELENDGTVYIRFGDSVNGSKPDPENPTSFTATYRIGNGSQGNVGAEKINAIVSDVKDTGITKIWNPMPASMGTDPETLEEIKQFAPQAFKTQKRAVTVDDYVNILTRHPEVKNAKAFLQWTGSWYTVVISIERFGGLQVDDAFASDLKDYLECYRLTCHDVEITKPRYVPIEISMLVCVKNDYFRDAIRQELLFSFSNFVLLSGKFGFFYPDNFTFGQAIYLSQIYDVAMKIEGVESVTVQRFQRFGQPSNGELKRGLIEIGADEIARLDNDRNFPENGKINFIMCGGM